MPIDTPRVVNTLDGTPPSSTVQPLPEFVTARNRNFFPEFTPADRIEARDVADFPEKYPAWAAAHGYPVHNTTPPYVEVTGNISPVGTALWYRFTAVEAADDMERAAVCRAFAALRAAHPLA